ncbi:MAG: TRAP transporter small permease [Gammaproteobacteria bacterium]|nr:TRAP transporter small permease [Gammaproteobacteria bacterium]
MLKRLLSWLDRFEEFSIALALGLMTLLTFVQVVLRYVFQSGFVWSLEATTYLFGWLVLIGMAYGVRTNAHIAVDLVTRVVAANTLRWLVAVAFGVSLAYCAAMALGSLAYVAGLIDLGHYAQDIPLPRWVIATMLPLGFGLLALRLGQAGTRYFMPQRKPAGDAPLDAGKPPTGGAPQ